MAPEGAPAPSLGRVALIHSPPGGRVVATAHGSSVAFRDATVLNPSLDLTLSPRRGGGVG